MSAGRRSVAILGSTGSIGQSTLDVIRAFPGEFEVVGLAAGRSADVLLAQAREFRPQVVGLADPTAAERFRSEWTGADCPEMVVGEEAARELASQVSADIVVNGIVGSCGLLPTLAALESGKTVAIANKEPLVVAGEVVMEAARRGEGSLIPLDSELSAIHQCLGTAPAESIARVVLTASGGPFRTRPAGSFDTITLEQALDHPTWSMGPKITVDSATLMNKGLEIIETRWYFDLPYERIAVVVHPQSLVHSVVEFRDGSLLAQLSEPDMRLPIQYALTWPERFAGAVPPLDLARVGQLTFEEPDLGKFPCLALAREAGAAGGTAPAVLNAANEVAVAAFLARQIRFVDIPAVIQDCLDRCAGESGGDLEELLAADRVARREAQTAIHRIAGRTHTPERAT